MLLIAENMPATSEFVPLIGKLTYFYNLFLQRCFHAENIENI
jgi:hypothetical protein